MRLFCSRRARLALVAACCAAPAALPLSALAAEPLYVFRVPVEKHDTAPVTAGRLQFQPVAHDFGVLVAGSTAATTTTLKNMGQDAVRLAQFDLEPPFQLATTCPATLPGGAACQVTVMFAPTAAGSYSSALQVSGDAAGTPARFTVTGLSQALSTRLTMSPNPVDFGSIDVAVAAPWQAVRVSNEGNSAATLSGIGLTGVTDFNQSNDCAAALAPGAHCTVHLGFTPQAAGPRSATLALYEEAAGVLYQVAVTGTGRAAVAVLGAATFPRTQTGQTNTATVSLSNTGTAPLGVTAPDASSVTGTEFEFVSTTCTGSLAPAQHCTVTVRFAPTSTAPRTGVLTLTTSDGVRETALAATGEAPKAVQTGGDGFDFQVAQHTWSGTYIGVYNAGVGPLTVHGFTFSAAQGAFNAWWAGAGGGQVSGYCENGFVLQPGQYCGAWANGDGANGSEHSGSVSFSTSGGVVAYTGRVTVRGLTYGPAAGAVVAPTAGTTGTVYHLALINDTPFSFYFPMYTVYGGAERIGRFVDGDAGRFVIAGTTCAGTLLPRSSCTVAIAATGIATPGAYATTFQPNGSYQQSQGGHNGSWVPGDWLAAMGFNLSDVYTLPPTPVSITVQ